MLILVRHALPAFGPDAPPEEWQLDEERGWPGARSLVHVLPADARLVSSLEPKARQTLEPTGRVTTDARFGEVRRDEPYEGDFRARRSAYVGGTEHSGWESHVEVASRFDAGVRQWLAASGTQPIVIGSHGMAMTVWLTAAIGLADPIAFWRDLRMPDVFEVDMMRRHVARIKSTSLFQLQ